MPEIELPGHAQAAIAAYPELGVTDESVVVGKTWGIFPYLYTPTEQTMQFLKHVMDEIVAIFPSPYIHIGGDEAIKDQWRASAQVQARISELGLADEAALQSWFIARSAPIWRRITAASSVGMRYWKAGHPMTRR